MRSSLAYLAVALLPLAACGPNAVSGPDAYDQTDTTRPPIGLGTVAAGPQPSVGGVRGVTFFYLDGGGQGFPYVLEHIDEPETQDKIRGLLASYRAAGVNWIRVLFCADHFQNVYGLYPYWQNYPNLDGTDDLVARLNRFMRLTREGDNAGAFTIEVVLGTPRYYGQPFADYFVDHPHFGGSFDRDKAWITRVVNYLDYSNLGLVVLGGDLTPCGWNGARIACYGEGDVSAHDWNHGLWIATMWPWFRSQWPGLSATYEIIGGDPGFAHQTLARDANWIDNFTPDLPVTAASLYFSPYAMESRPPPGSSWVAWANITMEALGAYHSVTARPLWIDEYGFGYQVPGSGGAWTDGYSPQDQEAAIGGFLAATTCWSANAYNKVAWVAGNDAPYDGHTQFGLFSGFAGAAPIPQPAWADVSLYYNLQACP